MSRVHLHLCMQSSGSYIFFREAITLARVVLSVVLFSYHIRRFWNVQDDSTLIREVIKIQ